MILSFADKVTESLYHGFETKGVRLLPPEVAKKALNKLDMLNGAHDLMDLRSPPGNRLEALQGDMAGLFSIRVNNQWRIVFRWQNGNALEVRLIDYH
ncbi:type II toxin-antitoxin system RelE/ParE family toxin [Geoalkalibacter halelectricus]|uniref:Type II toxin-antitoxin system RelE/ParE family toxin n=1 Tax=Geoalkalibacter halelectricus TaxID=2847045 RepID=A0ABY5ZM52_9BACT|nr:type II toxin-antitoxin system RelE/ParE family toxin [Geoalkalibacter halelectricus]MDO3377134.1 type II toxin-antitoxin system RelE/ParE family toxin [Geoalkalibacter halelectricus]UWZ79703.1 type II toxin-antitoxin system RelE/ParE family toxin [Geoalkalibacter halelectricus]